MELKPNVRLPLSISFDERGITGATNALNSDDQVKVNYCYEPIRNQFSGRTTLYLAKRPGASVDFSLGTTGIGEVYQVITPPGLKISSPPWILSQNGTSTNISEFVGTTSTLAISSTFSPRFATQGLINSVDLRVIQLTQDGLAPVAYYASTFSVWNQIVSTFTTFTTAGKIEVMDGFGFILCTNNRIQNSNINTISTWPSGNFITKQIKQDSPVGLAKFYNRILAFGAETCEVFVNGGLSPAPLVRVASFQRDVGMMVNASQEYYCVIGNRMYFKSDLSGAQAYDGERFEKISTPAIDKLFSGRGVVSVNAVTFQNRRAAAFQTCEFNATSQVWLMFFPDQNEWFEWTSDKIKPVNNGRQFAGVSTQQFSTYTFENTGTETWQDVDRPFSSVIRFKFPSDGTRQTMNSLGVIGDTEVNTTTSQLRVDLSDDDGQTTSYSANIDMTQNKKELTRLGSFNTRTVTMTHVGNTEIRLREIVAHIRK